MAKHILIDAAREVTDDQAKAVGVRYFPGDKAEGESFEYMIPGATAGSPQTMVAVLGVKTLMTNTVSSFYEALPKGAPKGSARPRKADAPASDLAGLADRFAAIVDGDWGAERGGGGGVGYNLEDLLDAIDQTYQALGTQINRDKVSNGLANGGTYKGQALDAKAYRKAMISIEGVRAAYEAIRAAKAPTTAPEDAADDLT